MRHNRHSMLFYLDQPDCWVSGNGELLICEMAPEHRYNSAQMLLRAAERLATTCAMELIWRSPQDMGDLAEDAIDQITTQMHLDPQGWMEQTTLYRSLMHGLPTDPEGLAVLKYRARHYGGCPARESAVQPCHCSTLASMQPRPSGPTVQGAVDLTTGEMLDPTLSEPTCDRPYR